MHEQPNPCVVQDEQIEQAILGLLLADSGPPLWSIGDVAREIGDRLATHDAIRRLSGSGIVYDANGFICLSRTAQRLAELWE